MPRVRPVTRRVQGRDDRASSGRRARGNPLRRDRASGIAGALGQRAKCGIEVRAELPPRGVRLAARASRLTARSGGNGDVLDEGRFAVDDGRRDALRHVGLLAGNPAIEIDDAHLVEPGELLVTISHGTVAACGRGRRQLLPGARREIVAVVWRHLPSPQSLYADMPVPIRWMEHPNWRL